MLSRYREDDFYELQLVASRRFQPYNIIGFLLGAFVYSGIMTMVSALAINHNQHITNPIWPIIVRSEFVLLLIQLLITLFCGSLKNAFKFQRIQAIFVTLILLKISLELYLIFFLAREDKNAPSYMTYAGAILLIGGLVFIIASTIRGLRRVGLGKFKKGGKGLYDFQSSKSNLSLPIIFASTMLAGVIARTLSSMTSMSSKIAGLIFMLLLSALMQYGIALVWPEFLLLTYCKLRFESFRVKMPKKL